jgi:hypothetical protein
MTRPCLGYVTLDMSLISIHLPFHYLPNTITFLGKRVLAAQRVRLFPFSTLLLLPKCLVLISACNTGVCAYSHHWLSSIPTNNCPACASTATTTTAIRPPTTAATAASPIRTCAGSLSWQRWTAHGQFERRWLSADRGSITRNR